jgi:uncharacterized membrane protein
MTFESSKNMGGIGAILLVVGTLVPFFAGIYGWIIDLIGVILLFIGLKGFSDYYKDSRIFNNALYSLVITIIGGVITAVLVVVAALNLLKALGIDLSNLTNAQQIMTNITWDTVAPYVTQILLSFVLFVVFIVVSAFFLRRSLNGLSQKTTVHLFATAGLLFLIGAFLTIIIIGLALMWIAMLLLAIAFFQIPSQPAQQTTAPPPAQQ